MDRDWTNNIVRLDGEDMRRVIDIQADNILLDGVTVTNGRLRDPQHGAGLRMDNGSATDLTLANCRFVSNQIDDGDEYGAGAEFRNATRVLITNCVFESNVGNAGYGIGFSVHQANVTVLDSRISDNVGLNTADTRDGAGIYFNGNGGRTLSISGSEILANGVGSSSHHADGGAIYLYRGTANITNTVIARNQTGARGGGIFNDETALTLVNCTVASNKTSTAASGRLGGGLHSDDNSSTTVISNSIFWANLDSEGGGWTTNDVHRDVGTIDIYYSSFSASASPALRGEMTLHAGVISGDPLFAANYTDFHLKSSVGRWNGSSWVTDSTNSPCIDAGDPSAAFSGEPAGENGARVNLGAYGNTAEASKSVDGSPIVETRSAVVNGNSASLRGEVTAGSSSEITFYYGLTDEGQIAANWDATNALSLPQDQGSIFSSLAAGLQPNTTYWFTVYATNNFGEDWATPTSFMTGATPPGGGSGVIHVDVNATGVEDGLSWTNAYTAFEDALDAAANGAGTNIWIAAGTYTDVTTFDIATDDLNIYGGFSGVETNLVDRDWTNNEVRLDGEDIRRVIDIQADNILLDGVTVTNGRLRDPQHGAGLRMDSGSATNLTLANCRFVSNQIDDGDEFGAGAEFRNATSVLITNCVFDSNVGNAGYGIGFSAYQANVTVVDCVISNNLGLNTADTRDGAGIYFDGNGGYVLTILGSEIVDNGVGSSSHHADGGGLYLYRGTVSITNTVIARNQAGADGGGILNEQCTLTLVNCTVASNQTIATSDRLGGGLHARNASGSTIVSNCIFWANRDGDGGSWKLNDIHQAAGSVNLYYSSFSSTSSPGLRGTITQNAGLITGDPLFGSNYTDFHLKSEYGRWSAGVYVFDATNSPCIDVGDPGSDYSNEPTSNGGRINMGAYGNTAQASRSQNPVVISTYLGATNVAWTNATLMGELAYTGAAPTYVWIYYGTNNATTNKGGWDTNVYLNNTPVGLFSNVVSGLQANQTYWYTTYGSNGLGEAWAGIPRSFTTFTSPLINNTNGALITAVNEALLRGTLTAGGRADVNVYWGLTDGGTNASAWQNTNTLSATPEGAFSTNITGVWYGLTYYYRTYATNTAGEAWASTTESFTPVRAPALVVTNGMALWLAGDDIDGDGDTSDNPADGSGVNVWHDKSGNDRDVTREGLVDPEYTASGLNSLGVVTFDSDRDYMSSAYNFDPLTEYTIFSVARYTGGDNDRVISSATRDWRFGFHNEKDEHWSAQGTIHDTGSANTSWHIHAGHINSDSDPKASFWKNGVQLTSDDTGSGNSNYMIGRLGLGGYRDNNDESNCEIAEILIYDRILSSTELAQVGAYLDGKYGLSTTYDGGTNLLGLGIANQPATNVQSSTAVINADLTATGAVLAVWAYWGPSNGEETPGSWESSTFIGNYTNVNQTLSYTVTNLLPSQSYYFTFRSTNMFENLWGSPPVYSFTSTEVNPLPIINLAPTAVTSSYATANAALRIPYASYTVFVHWGKDDGGQSVGAWQRSHELGTFTNIELTNLSYRITNLKGNATNWYSFRISNAVSTIWATPSYDFVTPRGPPKGTLYMFR